MAEQVFRSFSHNPLGKFIAIFMFVAVLYFLSSLSGFSPINNSSISNQLGCNTCSASGGPAGAYIFLKPFGVLLFASLPVILIIGYLKMERKERPAMPEPPEMEEEE